MPAAANRLPASHSPRRHRIAKPRSRTRRALAWWSAAIVTTGIGALLIILGLQVEQAVTPPVQAAPSEPTAPQQDFAADVRPFFEQYCYDCHSGDSAEGELNFEAYADVAAIQADRRHWERVFDRLRIGAMPPADSEQPADEERQRVVDWLDHALFYVDCDLAPDPGRVTIRRLNRVEYNNTVRDLLGVDFQPADDFPSDDVGYGFDNIGDVLSVPPLLIEKYLTAAEQIADAAILTEDEYRIAERVEGNQLRGREAGNGPNGARTLASQGAVRGEFTLPSAGEYLITAEVGADQAGDEKARFELRSGDEVLTVIEVQGGERPEPYQHRFRSDAGERRISVAFINDYYNPDQGEDRNLHVRAISIEGPLDPPTELPAAHRQLIAVVPSESITLEEAARANLRNLLDRAFRRPATDEEISQYAGFVAMAVERGESFERAMQIGVQAVLVSPHFLFRVETDKRGETADGRHSLNDYELASRLSYFLWSSMPDDELFHLAEQGTLRQDAVLEQQVRRMMADPKSFALIQNFGGQWLNLRRLATDDVAPDPERFPDFDAQLREDIWQETELFFASIVRDDRPLTDLLTARYSFVNENLAELYGIEGVQGDEFRRVELTDGRRAGLLTHASILTLTSYPTRTSPVKRGQWVLENLLGDKPPDPPPLVPGLEETQKANPELSMREQLEIHRADPTCASCHKLMDDIGFGLENFDAIGRWRDQEGERPLDTTGTLPSGESFSGPIELIDILSGRKSEFAACMAEKLLTYALGRGLEYYDQCTIDQIVAESESADYRFSALLTAIVRSEPFRMQRAD